MIWFDISIKGKKLCIVLIALCIFLHPLARYGAEVYPFQVLTSEIEGAEFFASKACMSSKDRWFYYFEVKLPMFFKPELVETQGYEPIQIFKWGKLQKFVSEPDFSILNNMNFKYILITRQGMERMIWSYGKDPFYKWGEIEVKKDMI